MTVYDFTRPVQISREQSREIEGCMESFARQAATVLTSSLRVITHVEMTSLAQRTYAEYVNALDEQTHLAQISLEPLALPAIWQVPVEALMSWVDLLLGGHGGGIQPDRALSEIESAVVSGLLSSLVWELHSSLDPLVTTHPAMTNVSYRPRLAHFVPTTTVLVVVTFIVRQGGREMSSTLALPFTSLLPHLAAQGRDSDLSDRERAARNQAARQLADSIQDVPLRVGVRSRPTTVSPEQLLGLQLGDVIGLDHPADAPLDVFGGDVLLAHGSPGTRDGKLACLVVKSHDGFATPPS
ncbi:FliM/FliN family flagellar motor switch protein [Solicola sp. PLA-1-18]|uniref:FliM/FliN family flagellar motor switch protein n=1 Tax=Solicola sp. PLA-1-18 TaxID=3380532 RepID=UPI003B7EC7F9